MQRRKSRQVTLVEIPVAPEPVAAPLVAKVEAPVPDSAPHGRSPLLAVFVCHYDPVKGPVREWGLTARTPFDVRNKRQKQPPKHGIINIILCPTLQTNDPHPHSPSKADGDAPLTERPPCDTCLWLQLTDIEYRCFGVGFHKVRGIDFVYVCPARPPLMSPALRGASAIAVGAESSVDPFVR